MLDKYFNLLDQLKKKQLSRLAKQIRETIVSALLSDTFSPHIQPFLNPINAESTGLEPFTNFLDNPEPVIHIKQIVNALYHIELALNDVETVNLRSRNISTVSDLSTLYRSTIEHIYQAGYLITHLDFDVRSVFGREIALLIPLITQLAQVAKSYEEWTRQLMTQINPQDLPRQLGFLSGVVVDQMNLQGGQPDYEFLTNFGAMLPKHLESLTNAIENFSSTVTDKEPSIKGPELDKLQDHALQILNALEDTRGSHLFLPLKTLHYMHLIRHTVTLSMSIFNHIGHLNESSQDTIRAKLQELKLDVLPTLFGFVDKIEEQTLLASGTLTNPLMKNMTRLYQVLIGYTKKFVDFSLKGQHLLTIEDQQFTAKRLTHAYRRFAKHKTALLMVQHAQVASKKFFTILQKHHAKDPYVVDLEQDTKTRLADYYQFMQPFIVKFAPAVDPVFISSLTKLRSELKAHFWSKPGVLVRDILSLKKPLEAQFKKVIVSREFHLQLNRDIVASMAEKAKEALLILHDPSDNPYELDEATALGQANPDLQFQIIQGMNQLKDPARLTKDQAVTLYQFYEMNLLKLSRAEQAYHDFQDLLKRIPDLPHYDENLLKLRSLYTVFQSYLASNLSTARTDIDADIATLSSNLLRNRDQDIVTALSPNKEFIGPEEAINVVLTPLFEEGNREDLRFASAKKQFTERSDFFAQQIKITLRQDLADKPLSTESDPNRVHYVLKHQQYSASIADIRASLYQLNNVLNDSIKKHLTVTPGLPFPELDVPNLALAQSSQALGIKRFYNTLYYLEQLTVALETLHDESFKSTFAYNVTQVVGHLANAYLLIDALAKTPYFSVIAHELRTKLQQTNTLFLELRHHYAPDTIEEVDKEVIKLKFHNALFYTINAIAVLPEHIKASGSNIQLSDETTGKLNQFSEKITVDIERILQNSNSYFKLFLETPTMYRLFSELTTTLQDLALTVHTAAFNNKDTINTKLFTQILLEADQCEDNLGLRPGILTTPMKQICDAFYQGFLEPLALDSELDINLAMSDIPTQDRLLAATARRDQSILEQQQIIKHHLVIQNFLDAIELYRWGEQQNHSQEALAIQRANVIETFKLALPIVTQKSALFHSDIPQPDPSQARLDTLLNSSVDPSVTLVHIEALTTACSSYFTGLHATQQLIADTTQEKISYLNNLLITQPDLRTNYLNQLTKNSFDKRKKSLLSNIQVGLNDELNKKYLRELSAYLEDAKEHILLEAKNLDGKNVSDIITHQLQQKENEFKERHYPHYYQLELLQEAVNKLKKYVTAPNTLFENERTIKIKRALVHQLETLIAPKCPDTGVDRSVEDRLENIKDYLNDNALTFKTKMCSYHRHDFFTFDWLIQCVLSLLELVHCYTPERKKCYNALINAAKPVPDDVNPPYRFGFFCAGNLRPYNLPGAKSIQEMQPIEPTGLA